MSDLHRAVEAEIAAYRPDKLPPFSALLHRERVERRRRTAAAGALAAATVAGIAVTAAAATGGPDRGPLYAGPTDQAEAVLAVRYDDDHDYDPAADDAAVDRCLALPGVTDASVEQTLPPVYVVTVEAVDQINAFGRCAAALPVTITRVPIGDRTDAAPEDFVGEPVLFDPATAPREFLSRTPLPTCGSYRLDQGAEPPVEGYACLADSVGSAAGAELIVQAPTIDGAPVVSYWRVLPGTGMAEVWYDATRDPLGSRSWGRAECAAVDKATGPRDCETVEEPEQPSETVGPGESAAVGNTQTVKVFLSTEANCGDVRPVEREVPNTEAVATAALMELFSGRVTDQERAAGLSGFSSETAGLLGGLHIADGFAYVNLNASYRDVIGYAGTSCGGSAFQAMVASTLRQFPTVTKVRYAFDGNPRAFVEFREGVCPEEPIPPGDPCDPRPWTSGQHG